MLQTWYIKFIKIIHKRDNKYFTYFQLQKKLQNLDYTLVVKSCRKVVICLGKVWVKLLFVGEKVVLVSCNAKKFYVYF